MQQFAHLRDTTVLFIEERVVLAEDAHLRVGEQGAAHNASEHMEGDAVGRRVELRGVHHETALDEYSRIV